MSLHKLKRRSDARRGACLWHRAQRRNAHRAWRQETRHWLRQALLDPGYAEAVPCPAPPPFYPSSGELAGIGSWIVGSVAKRRLVHEATLAKELRRALSSSDCRGRSDVRVVFQRELERAKARGLVDTSWGEIDPGLLCHPRRRLRAEPPGHGWPDWDVTWDELLAAIDRLVDGTAPAAALVVGPGGRARPFVRIEARGETLLLDATGPAWRDRPRGVRVEAYRELARCGFRSSKDGRLACHPGLPAAAPEERRAAAWLVWHLLSTVYGLSPEERPTVRVAADDGGWPTREAPWREGALLFGGARVAGYTWPRSAR